MNMRFYNTDTYSCYLIGATQLLIACSECLLANNWEIIGIVSSDDKVIEWANDNEIKTYKTLECLHGNEVNVDYIFSIINGILLDQAILSKAKCLSINYHDSLLPAYAGLNSTSWAIYNGEAHHGISWHVIDGGIDTGPILMQDRFPIDMCQETAASAIKLAQQYKGNPNVHYYMVVNTVYYTH